MCPELLTPRRLRLNRFQRGFSIVSAIFLLVVLSLLGAMMVTFSTVQHTTAAQDIQGSRAYWAARAGAEWGIYQITRPPAPVCAPSTDLVFGGTLTPFTVRVSCAAADGSPYTEGATTVNVFTVTSTAFTGAAVGTIGRIERQVSVTVERAID